MTAPTIRDLVASGRITLAVETMDADGELRPIAHQGTRDGVRGVNALAEREAAWRANPTCVECGEAIDRPEGSGYLETAHGPRVAHRRCFASAVQKILPTFNLNAARRREEAGR